jgi:hypothetical protein
MSGQWIRGFQIFDGVLLVLSAAGIVSFWARTKFWLPLYVHILAAIGLAVMIWSMSTITPDSPISKDGPIVKVLFTLTLPAIIYLTFILRGGQRAAYARRFKRSTPCPHCRSTVSAFHSGPGSNDPITFYATPECPNCGQSLQGTPETHRDSSR